MKKNLFPSISPSHREYFNFYVFDQNNSGGSFDVDKNVCHRVVIEAKSEEEAISKFEPMVENQSGSCSCCGDRWSMSPDKIDIEHYKKNGYRASVYTHYENYEKRWFDLYGQFPRKSEPKLITERWGNEFRTEVYFENVEQYCQFMANAYGWTTPDIRIHYIDGTKLEIFKIEI